LVLTLGYAAGLVGWLPFWLATALFVGGFVALFEWRMAQNRSERVRRIGFAVLYGALIAAVVTFVFQEFFLVRLP
jgi:putative tricarboxylic transport membrane protein